MYFPFFMLKAQRPAADIVGVNYPFKITRNHHIAHLMKMMPLIAVMFLSQMFIMKYAYPDHAIGNYAIFCAASICSYIGLMYYYDKNIQTDICREFITTRNLFNKETVINIQKITNIIAPKKDCMFSTIVICCGKEIYPLRYIDNPIEITNLLWALKNEPLERQAA